MNVVVRYLAQLKHAAGLPSEAVAVEPGCTVADLLGLLAAHHRSLRALLLDDAQRPQRTLLVFVGDEQARADRVLSAGDEVTLMTPIAGGSGSCPNAGR